MSKSERLSKTAETERVKLAAVYLNNIAVGVMLGGVFVPLFGLFQRLPLSLTVPISSLIKAYLRTFFGLQSFVFWIVAIIALLASAFLHARAMKILENLKD